MNNVAISLGNTTFWGQMVIHWLRGLNSLMVSMVTTVDL